MIIDWLQIAARDRIEQLDHIAQDSPLAAIEQDEKIDQAIDVLADHPKAGRTGRVKGSRELVVSGTPFIAVYRLRSEPERIEIIRFLHGAQQWP